MSEYLVQNTVKSTPTAVLHPREMKNCLTTLAVLCLVVRCPSSSHALAAVVQHLKRSISWTKLPIDIVQAAGSLSVGKPVISDLPSLNFTQQTTVLIVKIEIDPQQHPVRRD